MRVFFLILVLMVLGFWWARTDALLVKPRLVIENYDKEVLEKLRRYHGTCCIKVEHGIVYIWRDGRWIRVAQRI